MAKLFNRVKMTVSGTPGTGTITLLAAYSNLYLTFAEAGVANTNVVSYLVEDGTDFEIGIGTYTSAGTTLSRDTVTVSKIGGTSGTTKLTLTSAALVSIIARKEDVLSITETQTANLVYSGPTSGGAATPTFRALVAADIPSATTTAKGGLETAVQSEMEAATGGFIVTPDVQHFHPSAAKCWCRFNVAGTLAASYNTTSITDTGIGDWTVNIATDFSTANYSGIAMGGLVAAPLGVNYSANAVAAGTYRVFGFRADDGATKIDPDTPNAIFFVGYGDQ